jgi:hypothetical protein
VEARPFKQRMRSSVSGKKAFNPPTDVLKAIRLGAPRSGLSRQRFRPLAQGRRLSALQRIGQECAELLPCRRASRRASDTRTGSTPGDFYLGPPLPICFDARVTGAVLRPVKAARYAGVLRAALTGLSRRFWDGCREMG